MKKMTLSFTRPSALKTKAERPAVATVALAPVLRKRLHTFIPAEEKARFTQVAAMQKTNKSKVLTRLFADWLDGSLYIEVKKERMVSAAAERLILNMNIDDYSQVKSKSAGLDHTITEVTAALVRHYCLTVVKRPLA